MVSRPSLPGLSSTLYIRRPGSGHAVSAEMIDEGGMDVEEAFAIADENTTQFEGAYVKHFDGFRCLFGDSMFASAGVVRLPEWCDLDSGGAIVVVPNRHMVLSRPLAADSSDLLLRISALANEMFGASPGPCSTALWFGSTNTFGRLGEGAEPIEVRFDPSKSNPFQTPTFHPGPFFDAALSRFDKRAA